MTGFKYAAKPSRRRVCVRCGKSRTPNFYVSARGRVCTMCQKTHKTARNRDARLRMVYGISIDEYDELFELQGKACAICKGTRRKNLDVDHDHKVEKETGETRPSVRGLLCKRCNRKLLPACVDNPDILRAAIDYLENPPARGILG